MAFMCTIVSYIYDTSRTHSCYFLLFPCKIPLVEVEGESEGVVKTVSERVGFTYTDARFCHVGTLYGEEYGFHESVFNDETPLLTFNMENPFVGT